VTIKDPIQLKRVATLPCEICVQEIAMLKNCMNKLSHKTQIAMQDSSTENYSQKILVYSLIRSEDLIYRAAH